MANTPVNISNVLQMFKKHHGQNETTLRSTAFKVYHPEKQMQHEKMFL